MLCDTKLNQIVTELSIRSRRLNISLVFTTRSYFAIQQSIRLNSTNYFVIQISMKREVQQIVFNHLLNICLNTSWIFTKNVLQHHTHPALRRRGDVAATSLCKSQLRRRYVSNETPNDVSMERRQDVSVVRLYNVLLERHNDVSKGRNNDAPSLRFHDVSSKSKMKHPTTLRWNVAKTS